LYKAAVTVLAVGMALELALATPRFREVARLGSDDGWRLGSDDGSKSSWVPLTAAMTAGSLDLTTGSDSRWAPLTPETKADIEVGSSDGCDAG
jgi:hypothetical protein